MAFGPCPILMILAVCCCPLAKGWLRCIQVVMNCLLWLLQWLPVLVYAMLYPAFAVIQIFGCVWALSDLVQQEATPYAVAFVVAAVCSLTTMGLSFAGTCRHFIRAAEIPEGPYDPGTRERVVYILALPAFFALMCFMCVVQSIQLKLGTADRHWCHITCEDYNREAFSRDMMDFYTAAADLFEGFSLWQFGRLIMASVKNTEQNRRVAAAEEDNALVDILNELVMFPVYLLSLTLCLQSFHRFVYTLLVHFKFAKVLEGILPMGFAQFVERLRVDPNGRTESLGFLVALWPASTFAVYCLKKVETRLHAQLVEVGFAERARDFGHSWQGRARSCCNGVLESKFWGVKIIVSAEAGLLAMQTAIAHAARVDQDLARVGHNSGMAAVCVLVAVIHMKAYQPRGAWIVGRPPPADAQPAVLLLPA